jgi:hypothetical protein
MNVLVACEFSGVVREAFRAQGHNAWSCDLLDTEIPGQHIQGNVLEVLGNGWDLMIAHPPCQYLASSGARWWAQRQREQYASLLFVVMLMDADIPRIAIENPVGHISTAIRKPDQIVQPWMFGHGEMKTTCLWLKHLPPLMASSLALERDQLVWRMSERPDRWKNRSRTYPGFAAAMAHQWGNLNNC